MTQSVIEPRVTVEQLRLADKTDYFDTFSQDDIRRYLLSAADQLEAFHQDAEMVIGYIERRAVTEGSIKAVPLNPAWVRSGLRHALGLEYDGDPVAARPRCKRCGATEGPQCTPRGEDAAT